jgi:hypothetical protein
MVVTTILFAQTTFLWATCCLICFIPIVKQFLTHWSWLRVVPFIERGNRAHGGCVQSTGDAYSSMAPDPTSDIFRGPCTPILWFVFPISLMRLITDRYFLSFLQSRLKTAFRKYGIYIRRNFLRSNAVGCVLDHHCCTEFDCRFFCLHNLEKGVTVCMTFWQVMHIDPRHLIPLLVNTNVLVSPNVWSVFVIGFMNVVIVQYSISLSTRKKHTYVTSTNIWRFAVNIALNWCPHLMFFISLKRYLIISNCWGGVCWRTKEFW